LHPVYGDMRTWGGPNIQAITIDEAQRWCNENRGYCKVIGELIAEIPTKTDGITPDFENMVDYEVINNN
jgi:hypothetical protein